MTSRRLERISTTKKPYLLDRNRSESAPLSSAVRRCGGYTSGVQTIELSHGREKPRYPIESVDNALRVLLMFRDHKQLRLSDVAVELDVAHSTAHRLMAMLTYRGFVQRVDSSKEYCAGPDLLEVGLNVVRTLDLRTAVRPSLERLGAELGETVHLAVLEGAEVRYLDAVESDKSLRVAPRTGRLMPAHCTSLGKALLAELTVEQLHELYPNEELVGSSALSITSRSLLDVELAKVREQGFAANHEESEEGVESIGVPVRNVSGRAVAALSVSAPLTRWSPESRRAALATLQQTSDALSRAL